MVENLTRRTGGCLCGAIRFETMGTPLSIGHCHCRLCQRATGAPLVTWAIFPVSAVTMTRGTPQTFRSSAKAERGFCAACGTQLTFRYSEGPAEIDLTVASFDDPTDLAPQYAIWASSRLPWLRCDPQLAHYDDDGPDWSPYRSA